MISVRNIHKQFNETRVLDGIDLNLSGFERIGLIGDNGSGKTTLLLIITGALKADEGTLSTAHAKIGYMEQELKFGGTAQEYLGSHKNASKFLGIAGLSRDVLDARVSKLSGGQKTRLGLAKIMMEEPNLLLLDEPTNNLDIEGLAWLEKLIKDFKGPVLFTSHDRAFLNKVANQIAKLSDGKLSIYGGNYDFYKEQLTIEAAALMQDYQAQEKYKKRLKDDISDTKEQARSTELSTTNDHLRRLSKKVAKKAKAREKRLEKQMASQEWVGKPIEVKAYQHRLGGSVHGTKLVLSCTNVQKSYNTQPVIVDVSLEIKGSQHVWLKGANGSGKSTLLKIISGSETLDGGEIKLGEAVRVGYFSQELSQLDLNKTGVQELAELSLSKTQVMQEANRWRIEPDLMNKPLKQLSCGQQTKVEFMKLLFRDNQLLLLDEPTNHLEIETRETIEQALKNYEGAILVASHDRYFLEAIGIDQEVSLDK